MREIKFRAWDTKKEEWFNRYGNSYFSIASDGSHIIDSEEYVYDKIILQQFIGLKDKNSKEIYEGDIVKYMKHYTEKVDTVYWDSETASFDTDYRWTCPDDCISFEDMEVIGNIYENPELLQGDKR